MEKHSYVFVDDKPRYFDTLIVKTNDCEAIYSAFGDGAHLTQIAVRFKEGQPWQRSNYALHNGELERLLTIAKEITCIIDGKLGFQKFGDFVEEK